MKKRDRLWSWRGRESDDDDDGCQPQRRREVRSGKSSSEILPPPPLHFPLDFFSCSQPSSWTEFIAQALAHLAGER